MPVSKAQLWNQTTCSRCAQFGASNVVVATPCKTAGILVIGEAPGTNENHEGKGFVGKAGVTLRCLLRQSGLRDSDFGVANICRCQPPGNRKPTRQEIEACLPFLAHLIQETKPRVLLAVGGRTAAWALLGPGPLNNLIAAQNTAKNWSGGNTRSTFDTIRPIVESVPYVVPMPHTSPRVINNPRWRDVAVAQVWRAVELWKK